MNVLSSASCTTVVFSVILSWSRLYKMFLEYVDKGMTNQFEAIAVRLQYYLNGNF